MLDRGLRKSLCSDKVLNEAFVQAQRLPLDTIQGIIGVLTADGPKAARTICTAPIPNQLGEAKCIHATSVDTKCCRRKANVCNLLQIPTSANVLSKSVPGALFCVWTEMENEGLGNPLERSSNNEDHSTRQGRKRRGAHGEQEQKHCRLKATGGGRKRKQIRDH